MTEIPYWENPELRKEYSQQEREQLAKEGKAMPDGSYPIVDKADLENAINAVGLGDAPDSAIRRHIIKRAQALGATAALPDSWNSDGSKQRSQAPLARTKKARHRAIPLMPEVRMFSAEGLEVRDGSAEDGNDQIVITGSPIRYNSPYTVRDLVGEFEETMLPGVASDVLGGDTRFLFNHGGLPLARTVSGTLSLEDRADRLGFTARLDARQQFSNDLAIAIERGDISQMSIGFKTAKDEWNTAQDERSVIKFAAMPDISAVTYPASPTTTIEIAQRMLSETPIESRSRLRTIYAELRSGNLGTENQERLIQAATALHAVLDAADTNFEALEIEDEREEEQEVEERTEERTVEAFDFLELEKELLALRRAR